MSTYKRMIISEEGVLSPLDDTDYEDVLSKFENKCRDFIQIKLYPKDGNIFNHNLKNWKFDLDLEDIPVWFNKSKYLTKCNNSLLFWFKKRFKLNKTGLTVVKKGHYFYGNNHNSLHNLLLLNNNHMTLFFHIHIHISNIFYYILIYPHK